MSDSGAPRYAKLRQTLASGILCHFQPSQEALALIRADQSPAEALDALIDANQLADAVNFLAFGLPKREAVWWACLCVRETLGAVPDEASARLLSLAEAWVLRPSEEARRAAFAAAESAGFESAASWSAVGAFWSSGSMAPAGQPVVPPGEGLTGKAVAGAIFMASVQPEPEGAMDRLRHFIAWGQDIAGGGRGKPSA